ncbi:MAG TPA: response regulator [Acidobacteriaceae bacterium]|jgi:CheY-like chemotaxis protein
MDVSSADPTIPRKVLIADDERVIADTLRTILNQNGFEAIAVYDGQEAIEAARAWPPEIFLSDVVMPGLNGIEAAIRISKMIPACHVVLFSGNIGTPDLRREAALLGNDFDFLQKPVHPDELLAHLRAIL